VTQEKEELLINSFVQILTAGDFATLYK